MFSKTKTCCRCGKVKALNEFTPDKRALDGKGGACKNCINISARASHKLNRVKRNKISKKHAERNRKNISQYKIEHGCSFCGFNKHSSALDFHHIDPKLKEANIGNLARGSWKRIQPELKKCIVVCSNCHRMLHAGVTKLEDKENV